ncbi:hypothetical protein CTAYLR_000065 [Chrysophaeum taylorii]|uniref:Plastid lipid-associated protein/fibrillin conserved domain-containing protein n=1 Tax=Chrysophaeum taylorii TaxID=2483200 RepID=A0AAD7UH95_9STRA|nr:hypothetical protein CTAYLR_000065 [Chrysophaeum taylorii]
MLLAWLVVRETSAWLGLQVATTVRMPGLEQNARREARGSDNEALLRSIEALEKARPCDARLLDEPKLARKLAGRWRLLATVAAEEGKALEEGRRGVVNASGLALMPDKAFQEIDLERGRVINECRVLTPLGSLYGRVSGPFRRGSNGRRADAVFDRLEVIDANGKRWINNAWIFRVLRFFFPKQATGANEDTAWLETTYLSSRLRVARGNKGSCFLLEKDPVPSDIPAIFADDPL